ncbi:MAG TPA: IPT/TIG domain-containing protein [Elusimicrobiota bacterium]|nr:IPT/TIG domain-containing protein [Elusimicrobiota bacterium]
MTLKQVSTDTGLDPDPDDPASSVQLSFTVDVTSPTVSIVDSHGGVASGQGIVPQDAIPKSRGTGVTVTVRDLSADGVTFGSGIAKLVVLLDGGKYFEDDTTAPEGQRLYSLPDPLPDGLYAVQAFDRAGNETDLSFKVVNEPVLFVTDNVLFSGGTAGPNGPKKYLGAADLQTGPIWLHNDLVGPHGIFFSIDPNSAGDFKLIDPASRVIVETGLSSSKDTFAADIANLPDGPGYVANLTDPLGPATTLYFNLDSTRPSLNFVLHVDSGGAVSAQGTASDPVSGILNVVPWNFAALGPTPMEGGIDFFGPPNIANSTVPFNNLALPVQPAAPVPLCIHDDSPSPRQCFPEDDLGPAYIGSVTLRATAVSGLNSLGNSISFFTGPAVTPELGAGGPGDHMSDPLIIDNNNPSNATIFTGGNFGNILRYAVVVSAPCILPQSAADACLGSSPPDYCFAPPPTTCATAVLHIKYQSATATSGGVSVIDDNVPTADFTSAPLDLSGTPKALDLQLGVAAQLQLEVTGTDLNYVPGFTSVALAIVPITGSVILTPPVTPALVAGTNLTMKMSDPVTVQLEQVTSTSNYIADPAVPVAPPLGASYVPGMPHTAPDLVSNAVYQGPVTVTQSFNPAALTTDQISRLHMYSIQNGNWTDVTTNVDVTGQVTGQGPALSVYALFLASGATSIPAAALDPAGKVAEVESNNGGWRLSRYGTTGQSRFDTGLPNADGGGTWAIGFDAPGNAYVLNAGGAARVYEVSPAGTLLSASSYSGLGGVPGGVDSDGSSLWIAGTAGGGAALWKTSASSAALVASAPGGAATTVLSDGSGPVFFAGASGETALWRYDPSGVVVQYAWTNTLGGTGSSAQGLVKDGDGNLWISGWANTTAGRSAALWEWNGSALSLIAVSTGTNEQAFGIDLDAAGRFWLSGRAQGAGSRPDLKLWQYPVTGGAFLVPANSFAGAGSSSKTDLGPSIDVFDGNAWLLAREPGGTYGVDASPAATGSLTGTLTDAAGFNGGSVYFLASATPDFQGDLLLLGPVSAPNSGTSFSYSLGGLAAPSTFYLLASYDLSGALAAGGPSPGAGDPIGAPPSPAVFTAAGGATTAPVIALAADSTPPAVAIVAPADGTTIPDAALALQGTASDATGVAGLALGVESLTDGTWWDQNSGAFVPAPSLVWNSGVLALTGAMNAASWSADASFLRPLLQPNAAYRFFVQATDISGNLSVSSSTVLIASTGPATVEGTISYPFGLAPGTPVSVLISSDGFNSTTLIPLVSTNAASIPYSLTLSAPENIQLAAFVGFDSSQLSSATPLGVYSNLAVVSLPFAGVAVHGADFSIADDTIPPTSSILSPVDGSSITSLSLIQGTAQDNGVLTGLVRVAVEDLANSKWWDSVGRQWIVSSAPVVSKLQAAPSAWTQSFAWAVDASSSATSAANSLGGLAGSLVPGHSYQILATVNDLAKNKQIQPAAAFFVWQPSTGMASFGGYQLNPSTGPIGIPFTIAGSGGFGSYAGAATEVLIGGATAPLSVWNDTTINGTIPGLSTGTYPVLIQISTSVLPAGFFSVLLPSANSISVASAPIGATFTIAGSQFGPYAGSQTRVLIGGVTAPLSAWNDDVIAGTVPGLSTGTYSIAIQRATGDGGLMGINPFSLQVTAPVIASISPSSGPIGATFALSGASFGAYAGALTQVLFNGATVPLSVWNDASISGTVPSGSPPGTYPVVVERLTSDGGLVLSNTAYFQVVGVHLFAVNPATGPIGIPFTIAGSGFGAYDGANTLVLLGGTTAALSVWNDSTISGTVPALSTGAYPVYVERIQGAATAMSCIATFTVTSLAISPPSPAAGPIGASFTLTGSGFGAYAGANTQVLIGGATAALSVWNDNTISGTVPTLSSGSQPLLIERFSGGGLEASNTVFFQVVVPAIASISPSSGPIGISFTLTGSGFGPYAGSNTQVLVAGATVPLSVWNDTTITGTILGSLGPGVVHVKVERIASDGGVALSTSADFQVVAPAVSGISSSTGPIGIPFTISGSGFGAYDGGNTQVLFGGVPAPLSVWNDAAVSGSVPALSTGSYAVLLERQQGIYLQSTFVSSFTVILPVANAVTPPTGPIGASFTIAGSGFGPYGGANTVVLIGGATAPLSVWNDSQVSGTVPGALAASTGSTTLIVERLVGSFVAAATPLPFYVSVPVIATMTPSFGPDGTGVSINGSGFGPYAGAATSLLLNGTTVPLAVWNDANIVWTVPDGFPDGTYPLVVQLSPADGGIVQSASATFTVGGGSGIQSFAALATPLSAHPDWYFAGGMNLPAAQDNRIQTPSLAAVTVSSGALAKDTVVTVANARALHEADREVALKSAGLGAAGEAISFGPEGTQFAKPVTIQLPYDPNLVPPGLAGTLAIGYFDPAAKAWTPLDTIVDTTRHLLSAKTSHFSLYQPLGVGIGLASAAQDVFGLRAFYVFPNPARGTKLATFRVQPGLADSVEVRVYDVTGRKVHSSANFTSSLLDDGNGLGAQDTYDHVWDLSGVGSGVFTYVITAKKGGQKDIHASGKVGVVK